MEGRCVLLGIGALIAPHEGHVDGGHKLVAKVDDELAPQQRLHGNVHA